MINEKLHRRSLGVHLTSIDIFTEYILPKIKDILFDYIWVDLFAGEGNLVLPILNNVPKNERIDFFKNHIYLFDIQESMIKKAINNALNYGIPEDVAKKNILISDAFLNYPEFLKRKDNVFHITNPPYLYLGYIAKNNSEQVKYFKNNKAQDLYQIALLNDLQIGSLKHMIYIVPTNFLFSSSGSNYIRNAFLPYYNIKEAVIFEKKMFEFTGMNVMICFFERSNAFNDNLTFKATKINSEVKNVNYTLSKEYNYRAGMQFEDYIKKNKLKNHLTVKYYLTLEELQNNKGDNKVLLLNSKEYKNGHYTTGVFFVNDYLYNKIINNPLFIRTVDTGSKDGMAGLYGIKEIFNVDGIFVSGQTYRTNPIQVFIEPELNYQESLILMNTFNKTLKALREATDGDFMTTYKYSDKPGNYIRKYLGLTQTKKLIETIEVKAHLKMFQAATPTLYSCLFDF